MRTLFRNTLVLGLLAAPMACTTDSGDTDTDASSAGTGETTSPTSSTTGATSSTTGAMTSDSGDTSAGTSAGTSAATEGGTVVDDTGATGGTAATGAETGAGGDCNSDDPSCTDLANCICLGCTDACLDENQMPVSDCVCAVCADDSFCMMDTCGDGPDGVCDPFNEGCACEDCADLPVCAG